MTTVTIITPEYFTLCDVDTALDTALAPAAQSSVTGVATLVRAALVGHSGQIVADINAALDTATSASSDTNAEGAAHLVRAAMASYRG